MFNSGYHRTDTALTNEENVKSYAILYNRILLFLLCHIFHIFIFLIVLHELKLPTTQQESDINITISYLLGVFVAPVMFGISLTLTYCLIKCTEWRKQRIQQANNAGNLLV